MQSLKLYISRDKLCPTSQNFIIVNLECASILRETREGKVNWDQPIEDEMS